MSAFEEFLHARLARIQEAGLLRSLRTLQSSQGAEVSVEGRPLRNFSSNDYLGLAGDQRLREAAVAALEEGGSGSGASRLVCGSHAWHERLEAAIARFKLAEAALSFSSGYAAALGTIPTLSGAGDVIVMDKLCHACLVDAARLSGAILRVFPHGNLDKLESHLHWARQRHPNARLLVVTESVFSMDGDLAPLREIVDLKERYGAWLFLDEAHGVGVLGNRGRGLADEAGVAERVEVQMGTLGKALGSAGAYIVGSSALREFLINSARSFIFSTAPPVSSAAAACAAVEILDREDQSLRRSLWTNIRKCSGAGAPFRGSAIFPVIVGAESDAMNAARQLLDEGFLVPAIRFPTVPRGSARLRVTVTAGHHAEAIDGLLAALKRAGYCGSGSNEVAAPAAEAPVETGDSESDGACPEKGAAGIPPPRPPGPENKLGSGACSDIVGNGPPPEVGNPPVVGETGFCARACS